MISSIKAIIRSAPPPAENTWKIAAGRVGTPVSAAWITRRKPAISGAITSSEYSTENTNRPAITVASVMPRPCCTKICSSVGTSATSSSRPAAPKIAFGFWLPRLIACFSQPQPAPGPNARVVMCVPGR
jgi:hypothetical protein